MTENLTLFMADKKVKTENEKVAISKNFLDEKGEPLKWEIRALSSIEDAEIKKRCMVTRTSKRGSSTEVDSIMLMLHYAAASVVFPDLSDVALQDSYKVKTSTELLKAMLLPGEISRLSEMAQKLSGYDETLDDMVDDAKNSLEAENGSQ